MLRPYSNRGNLVSSLVNTREKGRAIMDGVRNVYYGMTTDRLRTLRSKKVVELQRFEGAHHTYFSQQEARKLRQQITWIDAVLRLRAEQVELF